MQSDYLYFVQWTQVDSLFIGYCPDLFIGGVCHGTDEQKVYRELSRLVAEEIAERTRSRHALPKKRAQATLAATVELTTPYISRVE